MNKKLIIIIVILLILGLIFVVLTDRKSEALEEGTVPERGLASTEQEKEVRPPQIELSSEEKLNQDLSLRARSFAGRYGSYSTDADFQNLYELKSQITPRFWQEQVVPADKQVRPASKIPTEFYGITTKALSVEEIEFDPEAKAEFLVSCQRQEIRGTEEKVLYQDINIIFVKVGDKWLVDSAEWQ